MENFKQTIVGKIEQWPSWTHLPASIINILWILFSLYPLSQTLSPSLLEYFKANARYRSGHLREKRWIIKDGTQDCSFKNWVVSNTIIWDKEYKKSSSFIEKSLFLYMPVGEIGISKYGFRAKDDRLSSDNKRLNHPGIGRNDRILGNTSLRHWMKKWKQWKRLRREVQRSRRCIVRMIS